MHDGFRQLYQNSSSINSSLKPLTVEDYSQVVVIFCWTRLVEIDRRLKEVESNGEAYFMV